MKKLILFCLCYSVATALASGLPMPSDNARGEHRQEPPLHFAPLERVPDQMELHKRRNSDFLNSKFYERLKDGVFSPTTPTKEWTASSGTNDVCIAVCTDSIQYRNSVILAFREFRFSADGRLLSISPVKEIRRDGRNPAYNHE